MSSTSNPPAAPTFMVVGTIRDDTDFAELATLRADEERQLQALQSDGRIGAHHLSLARQTVFLEVMATDLEHVVETLETLPFARFFDRDIYPIGPPNAADVAPSARF